MTRHGRLLVLGLSFKTAPVALRERLAFGAGDLPRALAHLLGLLGCREAAILSTCNRVELYLVAEPDGDDFARRVRTWLAEFHGVGEAELAPVLYELAEAEAARHLFEVAASMDSQIVGETEILGQAREAFRAAAEAGAAGPVLRALFDRAFFLAKELRESGGIGQAQASISSAAVRLAEHIFKVLKGHRVLVVGTGEMACGILRALRAAGVSDVLVASRMAERAEAFAQREGGRCAPLDRLTEHLSTCDIVLVSSAAPHPIIGPEHVHAALPARHGRPLFLIDISVPRNVDPRVHELEDTFLYDIDDLEEIAREGRRQREEAAARCRPRLAEEARALLNEIRATEPGVAARGLLQRADELRGAELEALRASGRFEEEELAAFQRAFERFQARLLHGPLSTLKECAREGDGEAAVQWVNRFFRLQTDAAAPAPRTGAASEAGKESAPKRAAESMPAPAPAPGHVAREP